MNRSLHSLAFCLLLPASSLRAGTIQFQTDPLSRRVEKRVDGGRVKAWLWTGGFRIAAELDAGNIVTARFIYAGSVNVPVYIVRGADTFRLLIDPRGSVRLVIKTQTGEIVQRLDYDELGRVTRDTNPGFQPFGFAGGLYDPDTGLVRFGARDYDAPSARWTSKDPVRFAGGQANLYAYAAGDPVNMVDPDGFAPTKSPGPARNLSKEVIKQGRPETTVGGRTRADYGDHLKEGGLPSYELERELYKFARAEFRNEAIRTLALRNDLYGWGEAGNYVFTELTEEEIEAMVEPQLAQWRCNYRKDWNERARKRQAINEERNRRELEIETWRKISKIYGDETESHRRALGK